MILRKASCAVPAAVLAAALALSGCGSSGSRTEERSREKHSKEVPLPPAVFSGADRGEDIEFTISADEERPHGDVTYICPAGGEDCTVMVKDGKVSYTGGLPMVRARQRPLDLGENNVATDATRGMKVRFTIPAGEEESHGDVTYMCPADGAACTVSVDEDGEVFYTGGQPTARNSDGFNAQKNLKDKEDELTTSQRVRGLLEATTANLRAASEARRKAEGAPAKATAANKMLSAFPVKGDSKTAKANAQAILDAQKDLSDDVVMSVENAIKALKERKTEAAGLDDANLTQAVDNAIKDAEAHLAAIRKVKRGGTMAALARKVKGGDGKGTPPLPGLKQWPRRWRRRRHPS